MFRYSRAPKLIKFSLGYPSVATHDAESGVEEGTATGAGTGGPRLPQRPMAAKANRGSMVTYGCRPFSLALLPGHREIAAR